MDFETIDMQTWSRRSVFNHFMNDVKCVIALTAEVDVTGLVQGCKHANYRFYPACIYLVAKVVNQRKEFRMGYNEHGEVGFWDTLSPSYIVFHTEDESFTKLMSAFTPDFEVFYRQITRDMEHHKNQRAFEVQTTDSNTFDVSCLPWISYKSLDMHVFDSGTYLAPVVTWGKYEQRENKLVMPLTMQIHHAAVDGFHVARFFSELQGEMDALGEYLTRQKG